MDGSESAPVAEIRGTSQPGEPTTITRSLPHLSAGEAHALQRIVERLTEAYRPERLYLFGSRARGDAGPDSDFDLLVVVPDTASHEQRGSRLAYKALRGTGCTADIVVCPRSDFERRLPVVASLPATVLREGVLLYAA